MGSLTATDEASGQKCHHQDDSECHRCLDAELSLMSCDMTAGSTTNAAPTLDAGEVRAWIGQLAQTDTVTNDAARIDLIGELETLTRAAAAAQAALSAAFDASQRQQQADAGIRPTDDTGGSRTRSPLRGRSRRTAPPAPWDSPRCLVGRDAGHVGCIPGGPDHRAPRHGSGPGAPPA